jgi:hypothetical protein
MKSPSTTTERGSETLARASAFWLFSSCALANGCGTFTCEDAEHAAAFSDVETGFAGTSLVNPGSLLGACEPFPAIVRIAELDGDSLAEAQRQPAQQLLRNRATWITASAESGHVKAEVAAGNYEICLEQPTSGFGIAYGCAALTLAEGDVAVVEILQVQGDLATLRIVSHDLVGRVEVVHDWMEKCNEIDAAITACGATDVTERLYFGQCFDHARFDGPCEGAPTEELEVAVDCRLETATCDDGDPRGFRFDEACEDLRCSMGDAR